MPSERFKEEWGVMRPLVERALSYSFGRMTPEDVLEGVSRSLIRPFLVIDAEAQEILALVCVELSKYPQKTVFEVTLAGGEHLDRWKHILELFERMAWGLGCDQFEITGRPGWSRALNLKSQTHTLIVENPNGK